MHRVLRVMLALLLVTAVGCASPTVRKNASYSGAANLSDTLKTAKVGCTDYKDDSVHPDAESQGRCKVRGVRVRLATFVDGWERDRWLTRLTDGSLRAGKGPHYLVKGGQWVVDCGSYQAIARLIQARLGGEMEGPVASPK